MKSYKKSLVFLVTKKLKDIISHSIQITEIFFAIDYIFKAKTSFYSNASQYSGAVNASKNFDSFINLNVRSKQTIKFINFFNCKMLIESSQKVQECLMYANSISYISIVFSSMFSIFQ